MTSKHETRPLRHGLAAVLIPRCPCCRGPHPVIGSELCKTCRQLDNNTVQQRIQANRDTDQIRQRQTAARQAKLRAPQSPPTHRRRSKSA